MIQKALTCFIPLGWSVAEICHYVHESAPLPSLSHQTDKSDCPLCCWATKRTVPGTFDTNKHLVQELHKKITRTLQDVYKKYTKRLQQQYKKTARSIQEEQRCKNVLMQVVAAELAGWGPYCGGRRKR